MRWIEITEALLKDVENTVFNRRQNSSIEKLRKNADKVASNYLKVRGVAPETIGAEQADKAKEAVKKIGIEGQGQSDIESEPAKIIAKYDIRKAFYGKTNPTAANYQERTQLGTIFSIIHSVPMIKRDGTENNVPEKFFCRVPNGMFKVGNLPNGIDAVIYDGSKGYVVNMKYATSSNIRDEINSFVTTCKNNNIPYFVVLNDSNKIRADDTNKVKKVLAQKSNAPQDQIDKIVTNRKPDNYLQNLKETNYGSILSVDDFARKLKSMNILGISGGEKMKPNSKLYQAALKAYKIATKKKVN